MGSRKEKVEIWDPLSGKRFWTKEKLKEVWHGRAIEFRLDKNSEELKSTLGKSYTTFRVACLTFDLKIELIFILRGAQNGHECLF